MFLVEGLRFSNRLRQVILLKPLLRLEFHALGLLCADDLKQDAAGIEPLLMRFRCG